MLTEARRSGRIPMTEATEGDPTAAKDDRDSERHSRAWHLERVCSRFPRRITPESMARLAELLTPGEERQDD